MKKKRMLIALTLLAALVLALAACSAVPARLLHAGTITPVDVGNNNDYGDGDDWGGDWGGNDTWDNDTNYGGGGNRGGNTTSSRGGGNRGDNATSSSRGGNRGSGSGGGSLNVGTGIFVAIAVIVVIAILFRRGNNVRFTTTSSRRQAPARVPGNHEVQIVPAIQAADPNFSRDSFLSWAKEVFITLQQAWTARDWSKIRPFEKEELFRQHELQLQEYIDTGRINIIGRINIRQAYLHRYQRDRQYEYLTVYMETRMNDYIIDEKTQQVVKGDPNRDYFLNYLLTFMRRTGVKTDPARSNHSTVSCPHCGAPVSVTSAGRCEYCGFIITTGEHDWVLSSLDAVRSDTVLDERGVILND